MEHEPPHRALLVPVLELRVIFHDSGFRWLLHATDGIELWRGMVHVGTLSGDAVRHLIEHHMATAALQAVIQEELNARRPLAKVEQPLPTVEARARLRAARQTRRKESR